MKLNVSFKIASLFKKNLSEHASERKVSNQYLLSDGFQMFRVIFGSLEVEFVRASALNLRFCMGAALEKSIKPGAEIRTV